MQQRKADSAVTCDVGAASDDAEMFELAPVSLWLENFSGVKEQFEEWRAAGITALREYLSEEIERVRSCTSRIRVIKVNRKTLELFEARDLSHLIFNLDQIFHDELLTTHIDELTQLWEGNTQFFIKTVNYTLSGRRLDIQLNGRVLPGYEDSWERVLVSVEDITELETARRKFAASEQYAWGLFEHSPVSLWVEDFSGVKLLLDEAREQGIVDFRVFTDVHPEFVRRCLSEIRVIEVNRQTLDIFCARDKEMLLHQIGDVFPMIWSNISGSNSLIYGMASCSSNARW